jgi:tetratricopeptide (TPR) repeat protein
VFLSLFSYLIEDSVLVKAMELGLNEYYEQSFYLIDSILKVNPASIKSYLLKAIILDYRMDDLGNNDGESQFFDCIDKVLKLSSPLLQSDSEALGRFYIGSAYALRAFRYGKRGIYAPVLSDIINGLDNLEKAMKVMDKSFTDGYLLIGLYNYATDQFPTFVKIIMKTGDTKKRKKLGIEQIEMASKTARYVRDLASYALLEIYYRERMYNKAYEVGLKLWKKYDHSRNIRWLFGKNLRALGKWEEAKTVYEELLYLILDYRNFDKYQIALASYLTAISYYSLGKYDDAKQFAKFAYTVIMENFENKEIRTLKTSVERLLINLNKG